MKNSCHVEVC